MCMRHLSVPSVSKVANQVTIMIKLAFGFVSKFSLVTDIV